VWYRPAEFAARRLTVPADLDDLAELSEVVRASRDAAAPWCLTMEAGASTGWVGTDWIEDLVLRRLGPDDYQRWVDGRLAFDSAEIAAVFAELDELLRRPGAVAGGTRAVLTVPWERTADLLVNDDPSCLMAHQGDFLRREFPAGTSVGPDGTVNFFQLPGVAGAASGAPLVVGGMLAVGLDDEAGVSEALALLASADLAEQLNRTGDFLSAHVGGAGVDDPTVVRLLDIVAGATDVQFDGSDVMPAAVGTGTFWSGMTAFFAGEDVATILTDIEAGWPASAN
jgi:alpha-glucoside transport system substrate-binding protein